MQRLRMRLAIEVFQKERCDKMIISGGNPHSQIIESETMARLAADQGIPAQKLILEKNARDTNENIRFSLPHLENAERIFLVSDSLHVHRAKRILCRQRADLCRRAYPYTRYEPLKLYGLKWLGGLNELRIFIRDSFISRRD